MSKREQWGSRAGFILAAVGSAIGLGNIWRFPYVAYDNGGGAFLIPYIFALLTAGIPFMILEFGVGQKYRSSAPRLFARLNPKWEWVGWLQVMVAAIIATYYIAVIGWTLNYVTFSLDLSWGDDPKGFFFGEFLGLTSSPLEFGGIRWPIFVSCLAAWGITWLACVSGIKKGIERANKVLIPALFLLVLLLIVRVVTLDGALDGLNYLFKPDFSKVLDYKVWAAAYGQIFYSLSVGFSIMVAYSSYLPPDEDVNNNAAMTVFINCGFSLLSGVLIFSVLGNMALETGASIKDVAGAGVGLAFVTIPKAINSLPAPELIGTLFFLCLAMAGVSSHISIVEACVSSLIDKFGWRRRDTVSFFCLGGFAVTVVFTTGAGLFILDIVDHFVNSQALLFGAIIEIILLSWVLNLEDIRTHVNSLSDFSVNNLWKKCLKYVTVAVLGYSILSNLHGDLVNGYGGYPVRDLMLLGWSLLPVSLVIAFWLKNQPATERFINKPAGGN
ncbi:sodium:neurotransmitter symporter [Oleidesulfovibrio alaskensis G20]|jgi:NSS family neurotransmitter:Na+ symporter|uniref:Transporter n=1 Tax=Oleidesulfovibrio alaskensis (strain ATCC BAA-1058 / DSM 17464 / G20) TaxID=207559 RepID=Q310T8_OLEA2|nr:sodium-dependent transporter [Oleidesulfovibrio alaskensis]ABB38558.1 sodium:neurotransmitter symporter [Oleidesulfovibrio alaskensis G20]MBG0774617.1 sodium-dependent transporter [Oleidesulfovibrio alaskensis]MBL3581574.1 sodium-dependent transporter [Oleidesulfovibrio alaskensis]MBL3588053.1 sodium-dependent transporter [bacterium]